MKNRKKERGAGGRERERGGGERSDCFVYSNAGREIHTLNGAFVDKKAPAKSALSIFVPSWDKVGKPGTVQLANVYNRQRVTIENQRFFWVKNRGSCRDLIKLIVNAWIKNVTESATL